MAYRAQSLTSNLIGWAAAGLLAVLTVGTLTAVALKGIGSYDLTAYDFSVFRFTVLQSLVSATLSVGFALPLARAISRQRFRGRKVLVTLLGAPFILPTIVAILGLTAIFGRNGILNDGLSLFGIAEIDIYGFHGVVLAHVFFNLPLATRLILLEWQSIPAERFRLAASLSFSNNDIIRHIERPMLARAIPGIFALIFLVCVTSFSVALTLGGGPRSTTLEMAIYQAFRFDFNLSRAASLAGLQFLVCAFAVLFVLRFPVTTFGQSQLDRSPQQAWPTTTKAVDSAWIFIASVFLILPMALVATNGWSGLAELDSVVLRAALRSVWVAIASIVIALSLTLALSTSIVRSGRHSAKFLEMLGYFVVAASPMVIGTGLFILLFPVTNPVDWAMPITALINGVMALPFCLRIILPQLKMIEANFGRLSDSLDINGWSRLRLITLPRLRPQLGFSAGLTGAFSMGDLGVVALFSDPNATTLPLTIYRLMASYKMTQAHAAAALLLLMSIGIFLVADRWGRRNAID
jgi:thiamine transport system permease protein